MAEKEILCAYGVDFDAVAGWLGSYGGENSPLDISRGMFAGEVGVPRLLDLFHEHYRDTPKQQSLEEWNEFWSEYKNA